MSDRCAKLIIVLQRKREFTNRTRNKTDELVATFLQHLEDDLYDMLCESNMDNEYHLGLDIDRDTETEIETAIRFFPNVLSRRKELSSETTWDAEEGEWVEAERDLLYPIHYLSYFPTTIGNGGIYQYCCNYNSAPFILLFVRLAIEFGQFTEELRGGLLCKDNHGNNVSERLVLSSHFMYSEDHNRRVDETFLEVLIQLRRMGLLKKEDIRRYRLLHRLCHQDYFAENRFRFLVEWDPTALVDPNFFKSLPLHIANAATHTTVQRFRLVFEYGIRYYPKKIGISLLFKIDSFGKTPFQIACSNVDIGYEGTMKAIEDSLRNNTTGPYNVADALITAGIDKYVHLDCVFFLLRREPGVLVKLSSTSLISMDSPINDNSNSNRNSKKRKK
jgi:hypothetical protein